MSALTLAVAISSAVSFAQGQAQAQATAILPTTWARDHFGNDAPWFERNVPAFECSDPLLTGVYAYRWQVYKSHLRDLGERGTIVTEFLDDVGWARQPDQSLNDATAFHIAEGRWLRDRRPVTDYVDYMYDRGGNDRHFSESIAAAAWGKYLVDADRDAIVRHLGTMRRSFDDWRDHRDEAKGLYFIEPLYDATEYSIASIEASGGRDGFGGGNAFRPTINSFMYANAVAISQVAELAGDAATAKAFADTAAKLRATVERELWNSGKAHFVDRYQANNQFVRYWDFVPGRELEGYVPWAFGLPDDDARFAASWAHLLSSSGFAGPHGLRTVEPSYQYYMRQYRYDGPSPECQWNGPTWPFDTTLVLTAMANLLDTYRNHGGVHKADYVRLLRQYAAQHDRRGTFDLQEDYNPDTGQVIVGLPRSHHYNHSGFADLVITGLVGLRPRADDVLEIDPLVDPSAPDPIRYFCLENVPYHGHLVTIAYDADGTHYRKGVGLSAYVDGLPVLPPSPLGRKTVTIPPPATTPLLPAEINLALDIGGAGRARPFASVNDNPASLLPAVDGRVWYWPDVPNYWSTSGSRSNREWYAVDFRRAVALSAVKMYFYANGSTFRAPIDYQIETWDGNDWVVVPGVTREPPAPIAGGENAARFPSITTSKVRVVFTTSLRSATALVEIRAF